jgi:cobalt/nickel transport system ATP-binding protein
VSRYQLKVQNLRFAFPDGHQAVRDITLQIQPGEAVGVIGANGAGKSTLLSLLMGVLTPAGGEIQVGDAMVSRHTLPLIRQRMGLVFQDPDDQLFMPTVYDDVAFGPRNYGLDEDEVQRRVHEALNWVGIPQLVDRAPSKLSGGEKRAVAIATVLAMEPDIVIMDEPTTGLDPKARRRLIALLNGLHQTKVITSHDLDMVMDTCRRVIVIQDGAVAADGRPEAILTDGSLLDRCGLEAPLALQSCPVCHTHKVEGVLLPEQAP